MIYTIRVKGSFFSLFPPKFHARYSQERLTTVLLGSVFSFSYMESRLSYAVFLSNIENVHLLIIISLFLLHVWRSVKSQAFHEGGDGPKSLGLLL